MADGFNGLPVSLADATAMRAAELTQSMDRLVTGIDGFAAAPQNTEAVALSRLRAFVLAVTLLLGPGLVLLLRSYRTRPADVDAIRAALGPSTRGLHSIRRRGGLNDPGTGGGRRTYEVAIQQPGGELQTLKLGVQSRLFRPGDLVEFDNGGRILHRWPSPDIGITGPEHAPRITATALQD
jgi:hypothetical protein